MESALHAGAAEPELKLIETLQWNGTDMVRLPLHLVRLARSASLLGWRCDIAAAAAALVRQAPPDPARMRLTLAGDGTIAVEAAALPPARAAWTLGLADGRLNSADPWLGIKSTRRPAYDAARAGLPFGLDEVVFQNERGEVCDGTITTLFFDRGEGLRTPPVTSGLLPGVLRAGMAVPEQVLKVRDLGRVKLWVGNSLRGLNPAIWIG